MLEQHGGWARELAELRDPAAHRVPIYVPPSVITSQEQIDKFRRIEAQADAAPSERDDRPISEIYREAQAVANFAPVMILYTPQGLEMRLIGEEVFTGLDRLCPPHTVLATDSSSIRVSALEDTTQRPGQVLNMHFYPPIWQRPMVELMGARQPRMRPWTGLVTLCIRSA